MLPPPHPQLWVLSSESHPVQGESLGPLTTNPEPLGAVPTLLRQLLSMPAWLRLGRLRVHLLQALLQRGHPGPLARGPALGWAHTKTRPRALTAGSARALQPRGGDGSEDEQLRHAEPVSSAGAGCSPHLTAPSDAGDAGVQPRGGGSGQKGHLCSLCRPPGQERNGPGATLPEDNPRAEVLPDGSGAPRAGARTLVPAFPSTEFRDTPPEISRQKPAAYWQVARPHPPRSRAAVWQGHAAGCAEAPSACSGVARERAPSSQPASEPVLP